MYCLVIPQKIKGTLMGCVSVLVIDFVGQCEVFVCLDFVHLFRQNTYLQNKKHTLTCQGGTGCYRFNYQPGS